MQSQAKTKIIAAAVVIAAVALIAFAAGALQDTETNSSTDSTAPSTQTQTQATSADTQPANAADTFKDGTYTTSDSYVSPGGTENIEVKLTLSNNVITDAVVTQNANNDESEEYQSKFRNGYKSKVIGKAISSLDLSRVSGASLTTKAFNEALDQIRAQARG